MASVFDLERLEWVKNLSVKRIKIASRSIYNRSLISAAAKTGKHLIVSLGMYRGRDFPRIRTKVRVDFLYCVAKYPTKPKDLDFERIDFTKYAGFSDHTSGIEASIVAMSRGAEIIEKHFTLDKNMHGPDHKCSMEPAELRSISYFSKSIKRILHK
jgi:sialic acid synthase SpsE